MPVLILASASPRRQDLLRQLGVTFRVEVPEVDETPLPDESPTVYVQRVALLKARAVAASMQTTDDPLVVLAADTVGVLDDQLLLKAANRAEAETMLTAMAGKTHSVLTSVVLYCGEQYQQTLVTSEVTFYPLSKQQVRRYCDTGEWQGKAGAYGIQGYGGALVKQLTGSYSAVVGLPLAETAKMLDCFAVSYWQTTE